MSDKVTLPILLAEDHEAWLKEMVQKYAIDDPSKVVRILIDYAIQDGDLDEIFGDVRCRHC
jgi:hypothetical protein